MTNKTNFGIIDYSLYVDDNCVPFFMLKIRVYAHAADFYIVKIPIDIVLDKEISLNKRALKVFAENHGIKPFTAFKKECEILFNHAFNNPSNFKFVESVTVLVTALEGESIEPMGKEKLKYLIKQFLPRAFATSNNEKTILKTA